VSRRRSPPRRCVTVGAKRCEPGPGLLAGSDRDHHLPGGADDPGKARPVGEEPAAGLVEAPVGEIDKNEDVAFAPSDLPPDPVPFPDGHVDLAWGDAVADRYSSETFPSATGRARRHLLSMASTRESKGPHWSQMLE